MIGTIIVTSIIAFTVGGLFGFVICALIVASEDDKEGRR